MLALQESLLSTPLPLASPSRHRCKPKHHIPLLRHRPKARPPNFVARPPSSLLQATTLSSVPPPILAKRLVPALLPLQQWPLAAQSYQSRSFRPSKHSSTISAAPLRRRRELSAPQHRTAPPRKHCRSPQSAPRRQCAPATASQPPPRAHHPANQSQYARQPSPSDKPALILLPPSPQVSPVFSSSNSASHSRPTNVSSATKSSTL